MKIRISTLRRIIREALLREVDTDPSNNPGRPTDAYEYLGMHPSPTAAMAHPGASGGGGGGGSSSSASDGGDFSGDFGSDTEVEVSDSTEEVKEHRRRR